MADIKQLYSDSARSKPISPKTVGGAVELESGKTLEEFAAETSETLETIEKLKSVTVSLTTAGWSGSVPYTQTVSVAGMTADWVPGIPTIVLGSSVDVTALLAATEALGCIKMVTSAAGTLTFTAPEDKPGVSLTLRVPGMVGR